MATIIVEDGTVVSGANSYASEAELTTYAADRGITLTAATDVLLIKAMDYIESLSFIGTKSSEGQALQWPRNSVYIDGFYAGSTTIPAALKTGQIATALAIDSEDSPLANVERATKREKVDVIEVEYMDNAAAQTIVKTITAALRKLLVNGGSSTTTFAVTRA
jgi:hypothetical protein